MRRIHLIRIEARYYPQAHLREPSRADPRGAYASGTAAVIKGRCARPVEIDDVTRLAKALAGVRRTSPDGLAEWRYHGRLVARQLDDVHLVIRADFDYRDSIRRQFPETFSVPARYLKHMMVVADLPQGDAGAIEDALEAAWQLQRGTT
jgi:hypothetical protein